MDTKWKRLNAEDGDLKRGVNQADMYQMFVYGKKYQKFGCRKVALVYPKTDKFTERSDYRFDEHLSLTCFPFDVTHPERSVEEIIQQLNN